MNKQIFIFLSAFLCLGFFSCSSDNDEVENTLKDQFFTIEKSVFNEGELPVGTNKGITSFQTSQNVINGGSSFVTVESSSVLQTIYVGVEGEKGFYSINTKDIKSAENEVSRSASSKVYIYVFEFITPQDFKVESYKLQVSGKFADGSLSEVNEKDITTIEVGTGQVQVALAWDLLDDVDLYLATPSEEYVYYGHTKLRHPATREVYAELDIDSNAACYIDAINKENIYLNAAPTGVYTVYVHLFEKCDVLPAEINYSVNVYADNKSLQLSDKMSGVLVDHGESDNYLVLIGSFEIKEDGKVIVVPTPEKVERARSTFTFPAKIKK